MSILDKDSAMEDHWTDNPRFKRTNMKTVIQMARSVGATAYTNRHYPDRPTHTFNVDQLERFAELVRADEREKWEGQTAVEIHEAVLDERKACANLAQKTVCDVHIPTGTKIYGTAAAKAIRARGQA